MKNINKDNLRAFVILLATAGLPALCAVGVLHWDGQTLGIIDGTVSALVTAFFAIFKADPA